MRSAEAHGQLVQDFFAKYLNTTPSSGQLSFFTGVLGQVSDQNVLANIIGSSAHQAIE